MSRERSQMHPHPRCGERHYSIPPMAAAAVLFSLLMAAAPLAASSSSSSVPSRKVVTELPGFAGDLPFQLETGYISTDNDENAHLFYYFVQSEKSPSEDPLILWISGGPGCSGFNALVYENGPLHFDVVGYTDGMPSLVYNPYTWTKVCNMIFVDSPVGAGFSYSTDSTDGEVYTTSDTKVVSQLMIFFTKSMQWMEMHPEFKSNPFYMAGDSYGGMIVPVVTLQIANEKGPKGEPAFNLKGYILGNPRTDILDISAQVPFAHRMGLISDEMYKLAEESCRGNYAEPPNLVCEKHVNDINECVKDVNIQCIIEPYCSEKDTIPEDRRRDLFELSLPKKCAGSGYPLSQFWANDESVRQALGVHEGTVKHWLRCNLVYDPSWIVLPKLFHYDYNIASTVEHHLQISNLRRFRALIYSGDHDMLIPFFGSETWIRSLGFPIVERWRPWYVDNEVAGFTTVYANNLTFATVKGAGHTAPEYKAKECQSMFERWIAGRHL